MSIIAITDFKGEQSIAQQSNAGVRENVQGFIDKYEPIFLKRLLGSVLANKFITGLVPVPVEPATDPVTYDPIDAKWLFLRDDTDLKAMLVDFVYYWYIRDQVTFTAGTGEVKAKNENSVRVSSVDKQVKAWNEMVSMAREFDLDVEIYPDWVRKWYNHGNWLCTTPEIYLFINSLNI